MRIVNVLSAKITEAPTALERLTLIVAQSGRCGMVFLSPAEWSAALIEKFRNDPVVSMELPRDEEVPMPHFIWRSIPIVRMESWSVH